MRDVTVLQGKKVLTNRVLCRLSWSFVLLWAVGFKTCFAQTPEQEYRTKAGDLFLTVERVSRLGVAEQGKEVRRIYSDVCPVLRKEMLAAFTSITWPSTIGPDGQRLSPEELVAVYERQGGWPLVAQAARGGCKGFLDSHAKEVEALAREDIPSEDRKRVERGLWAAGDLQLIGLYDAVAAQLGGAEDGVAANTLRELNDPRAIPLLARRDIKNHFEMLRHLQRARPANSELQALLDDKDGEIRWRAAYALAESGDPRLTPIVEHLVRDEEPQVRTQAAYIGFSLPSDAFIRVRPLLTGLLADKAIDVRSSVVILFASRKDTVCARALYDLLMHEEKLEPWRQSNLVQALQTLTGSYFGFIPGTISMESARRASLDRFSHWISEYARDSQ